MEDSNAYKYCFRDIVFELIQRMKENADKQCDDVGYRSAMFEVLATVKSQATTFELDLEYLGFGDFDPESWFINYAKTP